TRGVRRDVRGVTPILELKISRSSGSRTEASRNRPLRGSRGEAFRVCSEAGPARLALESPETLVDILNPAEIFGPCPREHARQAVDACRDPEQGVFDALEVPGMHFYQALFAKHGITMASRADIER